MTASDQPATLLALEAGVRETGWAIFRDGVPVTTGTIGSAGRRGLDASTRVSRLVEALDRLVEQCRPGAVAHSQPSGIHWPVPALKLLDGALIQWSKSHLLRLYSYTTQEVRVAITGRPNTSKDELAYEVMVSLGLIGQAKTVHEWEAIAVGHYHLSRK
ncbi:MAG: crossover junction endodeoxyribonuclease RuvC [Dehalococcoidia bacterium]|nr:crossover junction endodeoxyribonuclease RuvC [Dehalococcoidia bacterium]MDP6226175.1 crossover junction endodeoxyribonuclease RuvC [Dehalococcoidia bacterium]MDP7085182.1 crossover junction endodeoxyribonuclease RuvC [Dehalococcoidia bacterium]MDP7200955.1 crossover junction endodeoxyribonuclease RuvC [Dehalococcoidia bacterium]MDP7509574.1 crossover junction endodeoxyribonuclease RuvC [Dehalococcoidia bacterium]